jgi:hypothetical protein
MSDFLAILKNIKFDHQLNFYIKNVLIGQIDHLNFEDKKMVRNTRMIRATRSTVA